MASRTPDRDTGNSPEELLISRPLRDFLPGKKNYSLTSSEGLMDKWKEEPEWRELALAPRAAKMHDRLTIRTKELPALEMGDL